MLQKLGAAPSRWRRGSTVGTGPPSLTCPGGTRGVRASLCSTRQGRNLDSDKAGGRCRTALVLGRVCTHGFVSGHLLEAEVLPVDAEPWLHTLAPLHCKLSSVIENKK